MENGIFRPLVFFKKEEIATILQNERWKIFNDETNSDERFLRNSIRKKCEELYSLGLSSFKLYWNFHEDIPDEKLNKNITHLKIDSGVFENISILELKKILDAYLRILGLSPVLRPFLEEIYNHLSKSEKVYLQNKEIIIWKSISSDMFIFSKESKALKSPEINWPNQDSSIIWNGGKFEIEKGYKFSTFEPGMKIKLGNIQKEISEIFREKGIPEPVRKNIPLLLDENSRVKKILFEAWDKKIKNLSE